jgi:CubicO group peptidase (beta-lactamase class C family)
MRLTLVLFAITLSCVSRGQIQTLSGEPITDATMDEFVKKQMDSLGMPGISIAVICQGKIVYHRELGVANISTGTRVDSQSIFEAASMSKPVFAYWVMKMVDQGMINLDTPLYRYMPYPDIEKDPRYQLITARIVLTHRTGLPNWRYFEMADSSMHIKYGDLYLKFTPGTQIHYSGEGFLYLAKVIAHLRGKTLQDLNPLFEQEVAQPLGMEHAWYTGNTYITAHKVSGHVDGKVHFSNGTTWPVSFPSWDSSYFNPAASLHTDALSYAHFVIAWMDGRGLSKKILHEMLSPQVEFPKDDANLRDEGDHAWGLGVAIGETKYGTRYEHGGNNGNFQSQFIYFQQRKYGYVFLTNCNKGHLFNQNLRRFLTGE